MTVKKKPEMKREAPTPPQGRARTAVNPVKPVVTPPAAQQVPTVPKWKPPRLEYPAVPPAAAVEADPGWLPEEQAVGHALYSVQVRNAIRSQRGG